MRRQHQPLRLAADDLARALSPRFLDGLQQTFELVLIDQGSDRSVVVIAQTARTFCLVVEFLKASVTRSSPAFSRYRVDTCE